MDAEGNKSFPDTLVSSSDDDSDDASSEASKDDEEMLVDVPFVHHLSNLDDKREEAWQKIKTYVEMKKVV